MCRSVAPASGAFRWQEVSCSPECGEEYLRQIIASRAGKTAAAPKSMRKVATTSVKLEETSGAKLPEAYSNEPDGRSNADTVAGDVLEE